MKNALLIACCIAALRISPVQADEAAPGSIKIEEKLREIDLSTALRHYETVASQVNALELKLALTEAELEGSDDAKGEVKMLQRKVEQLSTYRSKLREEVLGLGAEIGQSTPPWVISDLSMRFTHPELYASRDGLPKYTALYEFKRRGLLHRGMSAAKIQELIGEPASEQRIDTPNDDDEPHIWWTYSLHASIFQIEFSSDRTALNFFETTDGDNSKTTQW